MNRILDVCLLAIIPGVIVVFGLSLLYYSAAPFDPASLYQATNTVLTAWEGFSLTRKVSLLAVCLVAGMLLRAFNRSTADAAEARFGGVGRTYWHGMPVGAQILLAPITMLRELMGLLGGVGADGDLATNYGYADLGEFLRLIGWSSIICLHAIVIFALSEGLTMRRLAVIAVLWIVSGTSFVLGTIEQRRQGEIEFDGF